MLSRTAGDLYWMARYLERAENLARMLDVSYSLSLMPQNGTGDGLDELAMPLLITGTLEAYLKRHGRLNADRMLHFFALDAENPASLYNCLANARSNAHAVRGRITADIWENINATWLEMLVIAEKGLPNYGTSRFCEWVKDRSHLFRGATVGTVVRSDAYRFIRIGTFLERADNTLRLLDTRYKLMGESDEDPDDRSARAYYQWSALLRALSSFEAFAELYRGSPVARKVAELCCCVRSFLVRFLRVWRNCKTFWLVFREKTAGQPSAWRLSWRHGFATPSLMRSSSRGCTTGLPSPLSNCKSWATPFVTLILKLPDA